MAHGNEVLSTVDLLKERKSIAYHPGFDPNGQRLENDGSLIGLPICGGGALPFALGALLEFRDSGYLDFVDFVDGNSAAAALAASAVSGELDKTETVFTTELRISGFLSPMRALKGGHLVDLGVVERALTDSFRLDVSAIQTDPRRVAVGTTNLRTLGPNSNLLHELAPGQVIPTVMDSMLLPVFAGKPHQDGEGSPIGDGCLSRLTEYDYAQEVATSLLDPDDTSQLRLVELVNNPDEEPSRGRLDILSTMVTAQWIGRNGSWAAARQFIRNGAKQIQRRKEVRAIAASQPRHLTLIYPDAGNKYFYSFADTRPRSINTNLTAGRSGMRKWLGLGKITSMYTPTPRRHLQEVVFGPSSPLPVPQLIDHLAINMSSAID